MPGGIQELGVWLLAIPSTARMQDEAEEFIRYATSREQLLIAAIDGNPPPRVSILRELAAPEERRVPDASSPEGLRADNDRKKHQEFVTVIESQLRQEYGDLFMSQYQSVATARPRPRSGCWRDMESILAKYVEPLILADYKRERLRSKAFEAVNGADRDLQEKITACSTPSLQGSVAESLQMPLDKSSRR
jgi:hypothetical protein